MDRRSFLKLFAAAGPVAAVAPTYFFAPIGGWKSDVIVHPKVIMVSNPTGPSWVKERFLADDHALDSALYGLAYWQVASSGDWVGLSRSAAPKH